jgi:hypothetical protein
VDEFLIVDERDGRIVGTLEDAGEALFMLELLTREDSELATALSVVRVSRHQGALVGTEASWRMRPLQWS